MKATPARVTMASRQPRPIGSTRPSRRVPPSSIEARTMPAKIEQQRLGEDDDRDDGQRHAEPDAGPLHLLADERVAQLGRARLLDMGVGGRRRRVHRGRRPAPRSAAAAFLRPERGAGAAAAQGGEPADRVQIGRRAVEREGDELGAAADILPAAPAPPSPGAAATRLSADLSRLSPITKTWPAGTVILGEIVDRRRVAEVDRVVGAAVGQGLAEHRQPAIELGRRAPSTWARSAVAVARHVVVDRDQRRRPRLALAPRGR